MSRLSLVLALAIATPAAALAQSEPYKVFDTRPVITQGPYLVATGTTTATIVWMTDAPSHSLVRYARGAGLAAAALTQVAEPQQDGLVPVGLRHVVHLTGLEPGAPTATRSFRRASSSSRPTGRTRDSRSRARCTRFTTLDPRKPTASFSVVTDTHEDVARIRALNKLDRLEDDGLPRAHRRRVSLDRRRGAPVPQLARADDRRRSAQTTPLMYARGNHELRGAFARQLFDYIPTVEGRFYFARDAGPVHLLVLDTGEDKPDDTNVYAQLNRTAPYRAAELAWLREHIAHGAARADRRRSA